MADLLTTRLVSGSGEVYDPARWDSPPPEPVPVPGGGSGQGAPAGARVEVALVMTDTALLGHDDTPAEVAGFGPVPAALARRLVADTAEEVWVRRLYTRPGTGRLVAMESRAREFPSLLRRFLIARDEVCRAPWCGAPIRHADHVVAHSDGGATSAVNGQGLCQRCNQVKETPGWTARPRPDGTITMTTPTGHRWTSPQPVRWTTAARGEARVRKHLHVGRGPVLAQHNLPLRGYLT
jgi:hypothetical protein